MPRRKHPGVQVYEQLLEAGPEAVHFLVSAMKDEQLGYKERIDIAKDLLNRGFGKTVFEQSETPAVRVVLADEVRHYAG